MNKILLLLFVFLKNNYSFIENIIHQEYNIICKDNNPYCDKIHPLYQECGELLFDIWLSLDLLLSVSVEFNDYEILYLHIEKKIKNIYEKIKIIIHEQNIIEHKEDNKKLIVYLKKIASHQIVKYNDILLKNILQCQSKILIKNNILNSNIFIL
jgi:hypothetical protein